jgi:hypothetical protein
MKRCPKCNQVFTDEWLTFCTQDGTSLVAVETSSSEPPPTLVRPEMPPSVSPLEQPTLDMPGSPRPPPAVYSPPQITPSGWTTPPPPPYPVSQEKNLALVSMILGIVSIPLNFCCYIGVIIAPVAIGLGIYSLSQIKKDPQRHGGKGMAIAGIIGGALSFVSLLIIILIYGLGFLMSGMN